MIIEEAGVDHETRIFVVGDAPRCAAATNGGHIEAPQTLIDADDMHVDVVASKALDTPVVEPGRGAFPIHTTLSAWSIFFFLVLSTPRRSVLLRRRRHGDESECDRETHAVRFATGMPIKVDSAAVNLHHRWMSCRRRELFAA